ncbi:hypothetical protein WR25_09278 isoform C [Diploscapter pachys]|uniref:Uncharacterized protein n=1 Tax=Diploscapter pachys TaxID=2018661 RepID=A0A2A2LDU1_9BILA|nr:hypothetical protein WR25_09278 isoform C [Diploscapter pachys]
MLRYLVLLLAVVLVTYSNICTDETGHWSFGIADGVTDFAYGGVPLNKSFYCFEGCLNTQTAVQNYKVKLAGSSPKLVEKKRDRVEQLKQYLSGQIPDDPNAEFCEDATLRADINASLSKVPDPSCKSILNTLLTSVNRPGWCINVVRFDLIGIDGVYSVL